MCKLSEQYEKICKAEFAEIKTKLDRLDEAIRGNGEPGLKTRIDRLERSEATRSRLLWLIAGSAVTGAISLVGSLILQALKGI
jgi:hypothetical protein